MSEVSTDLTGGEAPGARSRRYGSWYVAEHRLLSMRSYAQTIVATSIGSPVLYLLALGMGLAGLVDEDVDTGASGPVPYLFFVAPALLATAAVNVAGEEATYPVMQAFKWNPILFAMNATPISPRQIVNGFLISIAARMLPTCAIYYGAMLLFGATTGAASALGILTATLTGMAVAALIARYSATVEEDKGQMAVIMRFGLMPMFLFSGTFFPLEQLPVYLQWIGWISPLWHGSELGRVVSYGAVEPIWLTVVHVAFLFGVLAYGWNGFRRVTARRLGR